MFFQISLKFLPSRTAVATRVFTPDQLINYFDPSSGHIIFISRAHTNPLINLFECL